MKPGCTTTLFNFHRGKNLRFGIHLSRAWTLGLTPCQLLSLSLKVANAQRGLHGEGPRALWEGLFTSLSSRSHGCGARTGVFTKSTVPPSEGTFGQKSRDVRQEANMRNADIWLLESCLPSQPVLACMFSHTLRHLGKRSVGVGVRQTQLALWPHCWLSL